MPTFFKFIEKIIVSVNIFVVIVSLAAMIALGFVQVILRNFFDSGFVWADIIIQNLVLWVGFAGAVVATARGRHIAIGALLKFIPESGKRIAHVVVSLFTSVVCIFLTYASIEFVRFETESGSPLFGTIPLWISELVIPATFCALAYQFLMHAFEAPHAEENEP